MSAAIMNIPTFSRSSSVNSRDFEEILRRGEGQGLDIDFLTDADNTYDAAVEALEYLGKGEGEMPANPPFIQMPVLSPTTSELRESVGSNGQSVVGGGEGEMIIGSGDGEGEVIIGDDGDGDDGGGDVDGNGQEPPYADAFVFAMPWIPGLSAKGTRVKKTEYLETSRAYAPGMTVRELVYDGIDEHDVRAHARAGLIRFVDERDDIELLGRLLEACRDSNGRWDKDAVVDFTAQNVNHNSRFITVKAKANKADKNSTPSASVSLAFIRKVLSTLSTSATAEAREIILEHVQTMINAKIDGDMEAIGDGRTPNFDDSVVPYYVETGSLNLNIRVPEYGNLTPQANDFFKRIAVHVCFAAVLEARADKKKRLTRDIVTNALAKM